MSVWVEIFKSSGRRELVNVTLHVSVWVEMDEFEVVKGKNYGHAPRERVSWNLAGLRLLLRQ